jgi:hypothetical protein
MPKRALEVETGQIKKEVGFIVDPQTLFVSLVRHAATHTPFLIVKGEEGKLPLAGVVAAVPKSVPHTIILGKNVSEKLAEEMVGKDVLDKWDRQEYDQTISFKSPDFEGQEINIDELLAIDLIKKDDKQLEDLDRILLLLYKKEEPMPKQTEKNDRNAQEKQIELKGDPTKEPLVKDGSAAEDTKAKPGVEEEGVDEKSEKGNDEAGTKASEGGDTKLEDKETTATTELSEKATWDVRDDIGGQLDAMCGLVWGAFNVQGMKKAARKSIITSALTSFESFVTNYLTKVDEAALNNIVVGEKSEELTASPDLQIREGMTALLDALKPVTELLNTKSEEQVGQHNAVTEALQDIGEAIEKGFTEVSEKVEVVEDKVIEWSRLPNTPAGDRSISDEGVAAISGAREKAKKGNVFKGVLFSQKNTG